MTNFLTLALLPLTICWGFSQVKPSKLKELDRALAAAETNIPLRMARAKERLRLLRWTDALEDLDILRESGAESPKTKLLRIMALEQAGRRLEADNLALGLAGGGLKFEDGGEIEVLYLKLKSLKLDDEAKEFLLKEAGVFPGDWKLRYLHGLVLEEEGREKESGEVFRSLLKAEGEVPERIDLKTYVTIPGVRVLTKERHPGELPPELQAAGWNYRNLRAHHPGWGVGFLKPFQQVTWFPESVDEVRAMSFCNLARHGELSQGVEGVAYPGLLAAVCRGDGSFEVMAVAKMAEEPDDFRLKAVFLKWLDQDWSKGEVGRERIWKTVQEFAIVHPGPAIEMGWKFVRGGSMEVGRWTEFTLELFGKEADVAVVEAVAGSFFERRMFFPAVAVKRSRNPELKKRLLEWALSDHGGKEPTWLSTLVNELVEESRVTEMVQLVNRYTPTKEIEPADQAVSADQSAHLATAIRHYEQNKTSGDSLPITVIPLIFQGPLPRVTRQVIHRATIASPRPGAEGRAQVVFLEELAKYYPEIIAKALWKEELAAQLDEIKDPVARGMLAAAIKVEDLEKTILELAQSEKVSHLVMGSWMEENRGNSRKAFELLAGIERGNFSEKEQEALDQRMAVLGAFRFGEVDDGMKKEARVAWKRLVKWPGGEVSSDLRKLAPLLGLEDILPELPEIDQKKVVSRSPLAKVKEFIQKKKIEEACEIAALNLFNAEGRSRREMIKFLEEGKILDRVVEVMKVKAKLARTRLAVARLARELKKVELAEEYYREILAEDPKNFEAHFGLVVLQAPDKQDFAPMVAVIPLNEIKAKVARWVERVRNFYQINVREEIAVLGLLTEVVKVKNEGRDFSFAASFLIMKEARNASAISSGIGTKRVGEFPNWEEIKRRRERALAQLMLERPKLALKGFAKLHANREDWGLTEKELLGMAKIGIWNEVLEPEIMVNGTLNWRYRPGVPAIFLWGADEYLRANGELRDVLDEKMMVILEEHRPESAKSLRTAARLVAADGEESKELFQAWRDKLPEDPDHCRTVLLRMIDDVLVYDPDPAPWMDELEGLWLQSMAGAPSFWSFKKEVVERWLRWRVGQGDPAATGFVERVLTSGLGPKEAWPILAWCERDRTYWLPVEIWDRLTHVKNLITRLFASESGRRLILVQMFKHDLVQIYGRDQLAWLFRPGDWDDRREEMIDPFVESLNEFSRFTASLSGERMAQCGLFLFSLKDENQVRELMHDARSREVMHGEEWHPRLRTWAKFLATFEKKEKFRLLDELLEEKLLLQEMMAIDEKKLRERLRRYFWSDSEEAEARMKKVLQLEAKD